MAEIIDGKRIANQIKEEVKDKVALLKEKGVMPCLAVVQVGDDPASGIYVRNKKRACEYVGIQSRVYEMNASTSEQELLDLIADLNADSGVNGILVQLPLPAHMNEDHVIGKIAPEKDVDGFHPVNVGNMCIGRPGFLSCTPAGIIQLLNRSNIKISGKQCVIIGRSNIVGKPMAMLMLRENATVTVCHSKTEHLPTYTKAADILIVAAGKPNVIRGVDVKPGVIVIDVGINRLEDGTLCGDVDYREVSQIAGAITPVPGGVGPMTIAMLLVNCLKAAEEQQEEQQEELVI